MIPAGFEKKDKFEFDDYDNDDFDDDDEFVFDFNQNKKLNNSNQYAGSSSKENNLVAEFNKPKNGKLTFEVNNNYFFDESEYILDDLKNAIVNKNLNLVKNLLEKHSLDVNCTLKSNWIPIMYAVSCGSFELTEYLVNNGADINFSDGIKCSNSFLLLT